MGLFDYENYKVILHPDSVSIPPFKEIWERDKSKNKHTATKELSYVYFVVDFKSPYSIYGDAERPAKVQEDFIKDSEWKPDTAVLSAIDRYDEFQETYSMKFLKSARGLAEKLQKYFDKVDFEEMDEKGNPVYKATDAMRNLKDVGMVMESLNKVEAKVKKEVADGAKVKRKKVVRDRER